MHSIADEISEMIGSDAVEVVFEGVNTLYTSLIGGSDTVEPQRILLAFYILSTTLLASAITDLGETEATTVKLLMETLFLESLIEGVELGVSGVLDDDGTLEGMDDFLTEISKIIQDKNSEG